MSSEVNMLTERFKISYTTKTDSFKLNVSQSDEKNDKTTLVQISAVYSTL